MPDSQKPQAPIQLTLPGFEEARERWQSLRDDAYEVGLQVESTRAQAASWCGAIRCA